MTLSKKARARAVQLPAWNEALGLPRPWDQQWSLRMQQILAYETDLLEYGDLFDGNPAVAAKVAALKDGGMIGVRAPMHEAELPATRPYRLVDDIEAALAAAVEAGAEVAHPPMEIPGRGKFAIYVQGSVHHGLWQL